jgi:predicted ATP-grasp superfamily ATP-dependent carboligase
MPRGAALVTDCMIRKALAAVRSLGRRGVRVIAGETTPLAPGLLSRFAWRRLVYPPLERRAAFQDALERAVRRFRPQLVIPMEEETLLAALERKTAIEALGARLPYAPPEVIRRFSDKLWTWERARALGIRVPRLAPDSLDAVRAIAREAPFPLVVKPRRGAGAWGIRYVGGAADLEAACAASRAARGEWPLVQERLPAEGPGLGVSLLFDEEGRLRARFGHRRIREYPAGGGASTLRESARLPDEVLAASAALLESERFAGPAMVEWKVDARTGAPVLLEVNPRFWGSLALAIRAGVDFPWLLYRLSTGERFSLETNYRIGVRARWFLPGDLLHFVERRDWRGLSRSLVPGLEPPAPDDVFERDDWSGALGAILGALPFALRPEFKKFRHLSRSAP